jgi:AcrR family transcriptional regulator
MRVVKEHDIRRNEILDSAEKLFHAKGYEKCTVNDILTDLSIAKGTFYHYFKSKQEVLDSIVLRYTEIVAVKVDDILMEPETRPEMKLLRAFMSMRISDLVESDMLNELHKAENILLHQKTLNQLITVMVPALVRIIEEGIAQQVWSCRYPQQYMQIFLSAALTLTDEGIFELPAEDQMKVIVALISMLEKMLSLPEDSLLEIFMQQYGPD